MYVLSWLQGTQNGHLNEEYFAIDESFPVTPMTALVIDADGPLTYIDEDGCCLQIVGDPQLLERLRQQQS